MMSRRAFLLAGSFMAFGGGSSCLGAAAPAALLDSALWTAWRSRFVAPDGRVVDDGNGGISHSEGQGYGMLLAVSADDRQAFDRIWNWTKKNLGMRGDGLFAWRFDPAAAPHVADPNNATDGDLLIAWALAGAWERWKQKPHRRAAAALARAVYRQAVIDSDTGPLLLPGAFGFRAADRDDGPVVNLSYWVFPAFAPLARLAPEHDWDGLARSGLALAEEARFGSRDLPADWTALGGGKPRPAKGFAPSFGWNAVRVPLYLAWSGIATRGHLAPYARLWGGGNGTRPASRNLLTDEQGEAFGSAGYDAIPALVACAMEGAPFPPGLRQPIDEPYYPATLRLLSILAVAQRYPSCL